MEKLKQTIVSAENDKLYLQEKEHELRMILEHIKKNPDAIIPIHHGTVKAGYAQDGTSHEQDEIYYILSGNGKLHMDEETIDVAPNQIIFIPAGCFHALDNSMSDIDLTILTFWKEQSILESLCR